jgi:hypothetical protein
MEAFASKSCRANQRHIKSDFCNKIGPQQKFLKALDISAHWGRPEVALDRQPVKIHRWASRSHGKPANTLQHMEAEHRHAAGHGWLTNCSRYA